MSNTRHRSVVVITESQRKTLGNLPVMGSIGLRPVADCLELSFGRNTVLYINSEGSIVSSPEVSE